MLWTFCTNAHAGRVAFRNVRADGTGVKGVANVWAQFIGPCVLASSSNCTQPTRPKLILFFTLRIKLTKPKFEPRRPNPKLAVHGQSRTLFMWYCATSFETEHDLNEHMMSVDVEKDPFSVWSRLCWKGFLY